MKMKPSVWTSYYMELSPEAMLRQLARQGWYDLELSVEHGRVLMERGQPEQTAQTFRRHADAYGISFLQGHLPWTTVDFAGDDPQQKIDLLKRWLELYEGVGVQQAVLHPGGRDLYLQGLALSPVFDRTVAALQQLAAHIQGMTIGLCVENMDWIARTAAELLQIIDATASSKVGICLDTGHLHMVGGDPYPFITEAGSQLKALHIADNEGSRDQHMMPYGRGTIDWSRVMEGLREIDYQGAFNLEIPGETQAPFFVREQKLECYRRIVCWMLAEEG